MAEQTDVKAWTAALTETGGSFHLSAGDSHNLPPLDSFYLEPSVVAAVAARIGGGEDFIPAVRAELSAAGRRVVRISALDVHRDESLRVAQVVTTLQRGGAERIALDLHRAFGASAGHSRLITLGQPTRCAIPHTAVNQ